MRFWFDTEFQDDGRTIELISIGVVAEDGREYYAVCSGYDKTRASRWIEQHVLANLGAAPARSRSQIRDDLYHFFSAPDQGNAMHTIPEFWAYCGEYDWIVLRQLFGDIMAWPSGWPIFAMDVEQWRVQIDAPVFKPQEVGQHNALADARYTHQCWGELMSLAAKSARS